jgi:tubulin--tyrosine ligase
MSNYYTSIGQDVFDYLPLTFHIKNGLEDESWYTFLKYYYKRSKEVKKHNEEQGEKNGKEYNSWIVKPGENSNRGNGIQVCLTLEEIKNIIKKKEKYSDGSPKTYIVQSYI